MIREPGRRRVAAPRAASVTPPGEVAYGLNQGGSRHSQSRVDDIPPLGLCLVVDSGA
jgi:hypothetical protein